MAEGDGMGPWVCPGAKLSYMTSSLLESLSAFIGASQELITGLAGEDEVFKHHAEGTLSPLDLGHPL